MLKRRIITVDPGKYATKAVTGEIGDNGKRVDFRTKTFKLRDGIDFDLQGKSYKVNFNNETYVIGDQGEEVNYSIDKATTNHKIATYTAITQLLGEANSVDLILGCPTSIYKNKSFKEEYKNYILNDGKVNINVNNEEYFFDINSVLVLPEGYGIVFLEPEIFKNNRVAVIDLGGLNMNFAIYNNMIPEISSMFTSNLGSNELETNLINDLNIKYGTSFTNFDIQHIIKQNGVKVKGVIDNESTQIINTALEQYMVKLMQETKKNNYNLELMDVVFVGGTSLSLNNKIKEHLPHAFIPKNPQWANVIGFHKLGVLKHAKGTEK